MGAAMNKGLTFKMGQTHVPHYHHILLKKIQANEIDPSFVITHVLPLERGPEAYKTFRDKKDNCIKVVLKPCVGRGQVSRRSGRISIRAIPPRQRSTWVSIERNWGFASLPATNGTRSVSTSSTLIMSFSTGDVINTINFWSRKPSASLPS